MIVLDGYERTWLKLLTHFVVCSIDGQTIIDWFMPFMTGQDNF